jgi:hypothetical protein
LEFDGPCLGSLDTDEGCAAVGREELHAFLVHKTFPKKNNIMIRSREERIRHLAIFPP